MKTLVLLILTLCSLTNTTAWAATSRFSNIEITRQEHEDRHLDNILILRLAEPHLMANNEIHFDILFRIGRQWTLGPTFSLMGDGEHIQAGSATYNRKGFTDLTSRRQYGAKLAYYFKHVNRSSPYISIHGRYAYTEITSKGQLSGSQYQGGTANFDSGSYGTTLGYQWQAGMIKLYLGGGIQQYITPQSTIITFSNGASTNLSLRSSNHAEFVVDGGLGLTF